jgi:Subtilase family
VAPGASRPLQPVVLAMRADPVPGDGLAIAHAQRPVAQANADGVDGVFAVHALEVQRVVRRIGAPEPVGLAGPLALLRRQQTIAATGGTTKTASTRRLDRIHRIAPGTVESLWMDLRKPPGSSQRIWWECWCRSDTAINILRPAASLKLRVSEQRLYFPDFEVVPVYATREDIERLLANTDAIGELRHASDTPHVYTHELEAYQITILDDLMARVTPAPDTAPAVAILDTGVARAHPLLAPSLNANDCYAVDDAWGHDDHDGHGTEMAGLALLGDLTYPVGDQRRIELSHRLESVKLLPPNGFPPNEPASLGFITQSAISTPEGVQTDRPRVFCMAVTNDRAPRPCRPGMGRG